MVTSVKVPGTLQAHRRVAPATVSPSIKLGGGAESSLTEGEIQSSVPMRTIEVDGAVYMSTSHIR